MLRDKDSTNRVLCAGVPYLRPGDLPIVQPGDCAAKALYDLVFDAADAVRGGLPLMVTGHLHIQGAQVSELSERRILVGGEEAVSADIFPSRVDYVALGHLHRPQAVGGKEHIRYAGAPFPMSVAEKDYRHGIVVVDFGDTDVREVRTIDIPRPVAFLRVPDVGAVQLDEVEELLRNLDVQDPGADRRPFLEVAVRLDTPEPDMRQRVDAALQGKPVRLTRVLREVAGKEYGRGPATDAEIVVEELRPEAVFASCHEKKYGAPPPERLCRAFTEILATVQNPGDRTEGSER
jgi:exonuclease SbcD